MRRKLTMAFLATLAFGTASLSAVADDGRWWGGWWGHGKMMGPGSGMMGTMIGPFGTIDTNDDGIISEDEAASRVELVFTAMDADEDGELTEQEFMSVRMGPGQGLNAERQKVMQERKKARFTEMDADKSGKVTKAEFIVAGKARFAAADGDKDGRVTPWEMRAQRWNW